MTLTYAITIADVANTCIGFVGVILSTVVAYHVYKLSKQKTFDENFLRRKLVQEKVDRLIYKIRNGGNSKVELINIKKYNKHYPQDNSRNLHGYTYIGAELKGYHFGGVDFIIEVVPGYKLTDNLYCQKKLSPRHLETTIFVSGTIPYVWIEAIDEIGDDTTNGPQFYVYFEGKKNYPYSKLRYFLKDATRLDGFKEVEYKKL